MMQGVVNRFTDYREKDDYNSELVQMNVERLLGGRTPISGYELKKMKKYSKKYPNTISVTIAMSSLKEVPDNGGSMGKPQHLALESEAAALGMEGCIMPRLKGIAKSEKPKNHRFVYEKGVIEGVKEYFETESGMRGVILEDGKIMEIF